MAFEDKDLQLAPLMIMFGAVVSEGNFTRAAKGVGVSKSQLSKQMQQLEERLGARLLHRTTRSVHPTEAGQLLYERCLDLEEVVGGAEAVVREVQEELSGHLRISAPLSFGQRFLQDSLIDFLVSHPDLSATIELNDDVVDIRGSGVDVAIRVGPVTDPDLVVRKLCTSQRWVVATPGLLDDLGPIHSPRDLADMPCLLYAHQARGDVWLFDEGGQLLEIPVRGRLRSNNGDLLAEAALTGLGIAWLPDFIVRPHVRSGALAVLFQSDRREVATVSAVLPARTLLPKKVRALLKHLQNVLQ